MSRDTNDIKAPDGYVLGGLRKVRRDGTILFQRGWWKAPDKWAGEMVWVHETWVHVPGYGETLKIEAAHPGLHIYEARYMRPPHTVICERTDRRDAAAGYRKPEHKAWAAKARGQS
jgi:hypothetical protein